LGFTLASFSVRTKNLKNIKFKFSNEYLDFLIGRLRIFLYLSFVLGLLRIYIIISFFGWESLYDYRQNAFLIGRMENAGYYSIVSQISAYVYILASFYIVLLAIKHALTTINYKVLFFDFILYATQALSIGGRMFVIDFISCYFFIFLLFRTRNRRIFTKKELLPFLTSISILFFLMMAMGVLRNDSNKSEYTINSTSYYSKLLYLQDGIIYTTVMFTKNPDLETNELDFGRNLLSIDQESSNFTKFRGRSDMEIYMPFVPGIIAGLYFDFGFDGSLFVWGVVCYIIEILALRGLKLATIYDFILIFILLRFLYDTPLLITGSRGLFRYLFILILIKLMSKSYFLSFDNWLIKRKKVT
jgi:hypothetical protein